MSVPWKEKPVTFARFMEHCLYDPAHGYYSTKEEVFGPGGDFFTSPYAHELFAEALARSFAGFFGELSAPEQFHIVELGAGERILERDILACLGRSHPELAQACRYTAVEIGDPLPRDVVGVIFSNEFFDALPVHLVQVEGRELKEVYVSEESGRLKESLGELSDSRIEAYMKRGFQEWRQGYRYEVNLRMQEVLEQIDRALRRGFVLTLDYGYEWEEYDALPRVAGTLMCYHRHRAVPDPFMNLGGQDITAHVNFEVMGGTAADLGWKSEPLKTQRQFLLEAGIAGHLEREEARGLFAPERLEERLRLKILLQPGGVSDVVKVLVQRVRC